MSKFKVGDRVRNIKNDSIRTVTGVPGDAEYDESRFAAAKLGMTLDGGGWAWQCNYELVAPTLDNLSVDDVVIDDDGDEHTVLDVHGKMVDLSNENGHYSFSVTPKELKDNDYTVKGAEAAEPELTELTLQEIADKLDMPVEKLRIKE